VTFLSAIRTDLGRARQRSKHVLWRLYGQVFDTVTVSTKQGRLTVFTADQIIGRSLFVHREFEYQWARSALDWLRRERRLRPAGTGTFLDVGANMGVISIGMLTGGQFGRAIAVEPDPRNFSLLRRNARQNGLDEDRYVCLQRAASDRRGELEFELSDENFGDHRVRVDAPSREQGSESFAESKRTVIRIAAAPLDELLAAIPRPTVDDVAAVWIDTQGHEGHVMRGGAGLFSRDIPVACEVWPYGLNRAGTSDDQFCAIARGYWSSFCVWRDDRFEQKPIAELPALLGTIRQPEQHENVIFLK
jgi:FkbM family methyltransferase